MSKVITAGAVNLIHPESGDLVTLLAGDRVPDWAEAIITNPELIGDASPDTSPSSSDATANAGDDAGAGDTGTTTSTSIPPAEAAAVDGTVTELRARAKELGVAQGGSKADLIDRITAKIAADAAATPSNTAGIDPHGTVDAPATADGTSDPDETGRDALVARATELGIDASDEDLTEEELKALIEDAED